jgi:hypothetical protein
MIFYQVYDADDDYGDYDETKEGFDTADNDEEASDCDDGGRNGVDDDDDDDDR